MSDAGRKLAAGVAGLLSAERMSELSYAGGWRLVRALPEPVATAAFARGADLAFRRGGPAVDRLQSNLARVAPDAGPELVQAALRSYARYWCEVFRLPGLSRARILADTRTCNEPVFRAAFAAGAGVVVALPHAGNWDQAGAWCIATGVPFTTVAERLRPASLFDRFVAFRESLGMEVLPLTGGPRPPADILTERLQAGGLLCLLADRDLSARGVDVTFFGAAARMPAGPATLALRTGAALVPVTLSFAGRGWRIAFHDPIAPTDVATMTQAMADAFASGIAAHPQDWHMLQRLWLDDLAVSDPRRARRPA